MGVQARIRVWFDDPMVIRIVGIAIALSVAHLALYLIWGNGPILAPFVWFVPAHDTFVALASASVAFLSFGRYAVLRQPAPFWVGMACTAFAIGTFFGALTWPGTMPNGQGLIAQLPGTTGWEHQFSYYLQTIFFLAAVQLNWPRETKFWRQIWIWVVLAAIAIMVLIASAIVAFERVVPSIVVGSTYTIYVYLWQYLNSALLLVGVVLSLRRYRKTGDILFSYLSLFQLLFFFGVITPLGQRYDLWFYLRDFLLIIAISVMLFGLLSQYIALYRREQQKTNELEALQKVTDPALAIEGLESLYYSLLRATTTVLGANAGAIWLFDLDTHQLSLKAAVGNCGVGDLDSESGISERFANIVAAVGSPYWIRDVRDEPSITPEPTNESGTIRAMLGVPIRIGGEIIGVVEVDFVEAKDFVAQDERLLEVVAERTAIAEGLNRMHRREEELAVVHERQRLARDLHDSVTQALCTAILHMEAGIKRLSSGNQKEAIENLIDGRMMAQETLREMRLLIFELRPPVLDKEGLAGALQRRLDTVEARAGLSTELLADGNTELSLVQEEEIYRIAQEALNNILKHAAAKQVAVTLSTKDEKVVLEVKDDGVGFDTSVVTDKGGLGLNIMRERAEHVGGTLSIDSQPGKGTTVRFEMVVRKPKQSLAVMHDHNN